jgi:hypothetical protein
MRSNQVEQPETPVVELFIWKWAPNEFRGDILSILTALHAEQGHPTLAAFEAKPVIERLEVALTDIRKESPGLLTCLKELTLGDSAIAIQVALVGHCDVLKAVKALGAEANALGLTGSSAYRPLLLPDCRPKYFTLKFDTGRVEAPPLYDPSLNEVVKSLERVDVRKCICYAILEAACGNYVQVYGCDGKYYVEWRTYRDRTWLNYTHYAAGRRPRSTKQVWLGESGHHITALKHELLERADVERIFTAFYRGEKRPRDYAWRNITDCFETLEARRAIEDAGKGR